MCTCKQPLIVCLKLIRKATYTVYGNGFTSALKQEFGVGAIGVQERTYVLVVLAEVAGISRGQGDLRRPPDPCLVLLNSDDCEDTAIIDRDGSGGQIL